MLTIAPKISDSVTFCLYMKIAGGIIRTGTNAIMVDAIPVFVYCTASKEKETPRKGPKKEPILIAVIPDLLENAFRTFAHRSRIVTSTVNPIIPAINLICVAANGS